MQSVIHVKHQIWDCVVTDQSGAQESVDLKVNRGAADGKVHHLSNEETADGTQERWRTETFGPYAKQQLTLVVACS